MVKVPLASKKVTFCVLMLFVFLLTLTGCKGKSSVEKQTIKFNLESEPLTLDPQICSDPSGKIVIKNMFEGLVCLDENGNIVPGVASYFENNKDYTEFTFYLRKDAYWSNKEKTPVLAKDFEFSIKRALKKETNAPSAHILYCIKNSKKFSESLIKEDLLGVKSLDDYTLKITLEYPNKNFLKVMAEPIAMPCKEDFFNNCAGQYGMEGSSILGNGPFKIKNNYSWDHFKFINLIRNENYSKNKVIPQGINFVINKDSKNIINNLKERNFDVSFIPSELVKEAKEQKLGILKTENNVFWGLVFNFESTLGSNLNFRKSIVSSLKRDYITGPLNNIEDLKILEDILPSNFLLNGEIAVNYIGKTDLSHVYSLKSPLEYLSSALKELKLKGFSGSTILCLDDGTTKKMVSSIIENLNNCLNCHFNMLPVSKNDLVSKINNKDFVIAIAPLTCSSEYAYDFFNMFRSENAVNPIKFNIPEYTCCLDSFLTSNLKDQIKYLSKARDLLIDNIVFYPLYAEPSYFSFSKNLYNTKFYKNSATLCFDSTEKAK